MNKLKLAASFLIIALVLSCGFLKNKVEEKVNEKIDEQMKKVDSTMKTVNPDSLKKIMKSIDSIKSKTEKPKK